MRKLLITLGLLMANNVYADTCIPKPDCADMGYTETSCNGGALKCPFDTTKLFCTASLPPAVECDVGMVYYSNGKCYSDYNTSYGIALGVVVVGDSLVMGAPISMSWATDFKNIIDLPDIVMSSGPAGDINGKGNTLAIVSQHVSSGQTISTSAAMYCNNHAPTGTSAGQWYLPAAGELYSYVYGNYTKLKPTIQAMGWTNFDYYCFWSSSESDDSDAWYMCIQDGKIKYQSTNYSMAVSCFLDISGR